MYIKLRKKPFRGEPKLRKSKLFESMIRTDEPPSFTTFFFIETLDQFRLFACSGYVEVRKGFIDAGIHKYSTPAPGPDKNSKSKSKLEYKVRKD